jgi:hypothetical protein
MTAATSSQTVYTKLGRRRALARAQRAMDDYAHRTTPPPRLAAYKSSSPVDALRLSRASS